MAKRQSGFTLIEILIVVIILGILAAIVIPQFTSASNDAKISAVKSTVSTVQAQLELYKFQTNTTPAYSSFWASLGTTTVVDQKTVGPWIATAAVNPFTNASDVADGTVATNWAYDKALNKFYGYTKTADGSASQYPK